MFIFRIFVCPDFIVVFETKISICILNFSSDFSFLTITSNRYGKIVYVQTICSFKYFSPSSLARKKTPIAIPTQSEANL